MILSIIIPCYNEARNIPLLLERCGAVVQRDGIEIVLVDNGSTDSSPAEFERLLPQYPFARGVRVDVNQGYGFGIRAGLTAATGEILAWTHADMQTDPGDALQGLARFEAAADPTTLFIKGLRHGRPVADSCFTVGMSLFESVLLRQPLWDINAQPTMFHRDFMKTWQSPPDDFSLDLYVYYQARLRDLTISRISVRFGERAHGVSHWNVDWRSKVKFIQRTIAYSGKLHQQVSGAR